MPLIRGASRSLSGPGISARMSSCPPTPSRGSTLTASTIMPMPPYHWVSCLQISIPRPWVSMSTSTVDPLAVKPEIDSNRAASQCAQPNMSASSTYGSVPKSEHATQVHTTTGKVSVGRTSSGGRNPHARVTPAAAVMRAAVSSARSPSEFAEPHSTSVATSIPGTRNSRARPTTCRERFSRRRGRNTSGKSAPSRRARLMASPGGRSVDPPPAGGAPGPEPSRPPRGAGRRRGGPAA